MKVSFKDKCKIRLDIAVSIKIQGPTLYAHFTTSNCVSVVNIIHIIKVSSPRNIHCENTVKKNYLFSDITALKMCKFFKSRDD